MNNKIRLFTPGPVTMSTRTLAMNSAFQASTSSLSCPIEGGVPYYHSFYAEIADVIERFLFDVGIIERPDARP